MSKLPQKQVKIFDTTLRDGQQCPGAGMSFEKNLEYAHISAKAGVDILEAGFPSASQTDFKIVHTIASEFAGLTNSPIVAGLCQLREAQIDKTIEALLPITTCKRARLHVYLPVDPELMKASLGELANKKDLLIQDVYRLVKKSFDAGCEVELSPEGYSRMGNHFDFTTDIIRAAISGGATVINCPDTIGGACYLEGKDYFVEKMNQHANIMRTEFPDKNITWSVHCHNDMGLALENSMNGVFLGPATQIEGCFNGIGERAGNVSLEQCIMYLKCFGHIGNGKNTFFTGSHIQYLKEISDFVSDNMLKRQAHWPVTGDNAARHTSGGHTNAILKNPLAYQPFDPRETGHEITFLFGPMSGSNLAKSIIEKHGYTCAESEKVKITEYIKDYYADRRKGITDQELMQAYLAFRQKEKQNGQS